VGGVRAVARTSSLWGTWKAPTSAQRKTPEELQMAVQSARNIEKRKKKRRRVIPRAKVTRIQGNTLGARRRLKKMAGKARAARAKARG
jgi:hypothetical protein